MDSDQSAMISVTDQLTAAWMKVLNARAVGTTDRFFDLGGSSLQLQELLELITREIDPGLSLFDLFERPTIAEMAAFILLRKRAAV